MQAFDKGAAIRPTEKHMRLSQQEVAALVDLCVYFAVNGLAVEVCT